ncbi:unnamed protein product [Schistosoma turkestanicum]|nr:unnamed protein product [Schistosoma turkestanicum]
MDWDYLFEIFFQGMNYWSYRHLKIFIKDLNALQLSCKLFNESKEDISKQRIIHNMIVIGFLYNMRSTLNEHFDEFYPDGNPKPTKNCLDEVRENFRKIVEGRDEYLSINQQTNQQANQLFNELSNKFLRSFSSKLRLREDGNSSTTREVDKTRYSSTIAEFFNEFNPLRHNYFMNVYISQKTNHLKTMHRILYTSDYITHNVPGNVVYPEINLAASFLNPSFLDASNSMSEKYAILGWLISRKLVSGALNNKELDERQQVQLSCGSTNALPIENQLCCLSGRKSSQAVENKNLKLLSADINGLMLAFSKYEEEIMKNKMDGLHEKKMFFEAFGKVMCE